MFARPEGGGKARRRAKGAVTAMLQPMVAQMGRYGDHMDWDDGDGWWMVLIMIVVLALVIGTIVWAVVYATRHSHPGTAGNALLAGSGSTARAILDERFARGEIDAAEYEERRRLLG
jgi:putative membrane protein